MKMIIINKRTLYSILLIIIVLCILFFASKYYFKTKDVINMEPYYQGEQDKNIISIACNIDWGTEYIEEMMCEEIPGVSSVQEI